MNAQIVPLSDPVADMLDGVRQGWHQTGERSRVVHQLTPNSSLKVQRSRSEPGRLGSRES